MKHSSNRIVHRTGLFLALISLLGGSALPNYFSGYPALAHSVAPAVAQPGLKVPTTSALPASITPDPATSARA